ncbi:Two component system histidine kinase [Streptococcus sp. DD10]|uniref:sensor histidine kinase n=1 Tax=Streptococcus sp. DD10 TaxID=1777878 RepID=UPI00079AC620|nr:HAMP domain-containing sensor histidine kinase [Streptococcus sp. DD10]KXT74422.1 Two component system histidine kinase [Streptococcus sp. DD10]
MFITNAGHELKTPLAIISANTELQELIEGESEWSKSTKEQTERLNQLIARLIRLSRLEEQEEIHTSQQNISPILEKVSQAMIPLMQQKGLSYERNIQANLEAMIAQEEAYELFSILLDNAQKYCDDKGKISITAQQVRHRWRKQVRIDVSNSYADGENVDFNRFFDRFYRAETSHNNQSVSGYGIGLSMAQHLTQLFGGKLTVSYQNQTVTFSVFL